MPSTELTAHLRELTDSVTSSLPRTAWRRMFGCDAAFVDGKIFALIWKQGRIGVKLPDDAKRDALFAIPGAVPWAPGGMKMSGWVLVPEEFHDDPDALEPWVREAHAEVAAMPEKAKANSKAKPKPAMAPPARARAKATPKKIPSARATAAKPKAGAKAKRS